MTLCCRATVPLPCVTRNLTNVYTDARHELPERALSVSWRPARGDDTRQVPCVELPHCRADLTCQAGYMIYTGCPTIEYSLCFGCFLGFQSSYRGAYYHFSTAQET